jgi:hypothetical protein
MLSIAILDKSKKGKEFVKKLTYIDSEIMKGTIKMYLERCKFKYVLAFLQWRNMSYHSNEENL